MNLNLKKVLPLAAASLLSITSLVQADSGMNKNGRNCNTNCPDIPAAGECKSPFLPATNPCSLGVINPNAMPHIDCARAIFTAELLYWNAHEDGLEYAISNTEAPNLSTNQVSTFNSSSYYNGDLLNPERKWDYGFRFGLGYVLNHDGWDIDAMWTHFRRNASDDVVADANTTTSRIYTLWSAVVPALGDFMQATPSVPLLPIAAEVQTSWRLHLDLIDLELGRSFYTSKYLTLRPHIGLRGASIRQNYDITYLGGSFREGTASAPLNLTDDVVMKDNFWGIGVRGGLNSDWHWSRGCGGDWSFYGNLALSMIYGRFTIEQSENIIDSSGIASIPSGPINILNVENNFRATRAMTDLTLGIRYDYDCCESDYHIALWLGWEHHIAFGMNQWARYTSIPGVAGGHLAPQSPQTYTTYTPEDGDLTTQGWTLGFGLDF